MAFFYAATSTVVVFFFVYLAVSGRRLLTRQATRYQWIKRGLYWIADGVLLASIYLIVPIEPPLVGGFVGVVAGLLLAVVGVTKPPDRVH